MSVPGDVDMGAVFERVERVRGFRCDVYKESCLRRRLAVRMRARGVHTYDAYAAILDDDAAEFDRLLDTLTVNVSKFYRNPETWDVLAERYLPELWTLRDGSLRCWSAGCASGEEAYTLGMLLVEQARRAGQGERRGTRVDATDIDQRCLAAAQAGEYRPDAFDELPKALSVRHVTMNGRPGHWRIRGELKPWVRFRHHNLTQQPPPSPPYDLVLCRNVMIYFDRATQERVFEAVAAGLAPGGYLVLGKVETLVGPATRRLRLDNIRERVYRRL